MLHKRILMACLVTILIAGCSPKEETAPSTPSANNAGVSLDKVASSAPAVLFFVKTTCGSNPTAIPIVKRIYEANKDSGKFFVVLNTDEAGSKEWSKRWDVSFPIIPDPEQKIISQYGVQTSQTGLLVDKDLKETKRFAGYGKDVLESLNASIGKAKVDLSDAPPFGVG